MYSINLDAMSNKVTPIIKKSMEKLEGARDGISSMGIVEDFYYYTELKSKIPEEISDSIDRMTKVQGWMEYAIIKAEYAEEINEVIINGNLAEFLQENPYNLEPKVLGVITSEVLLDWGYIITDDLIENDVRYSVDGLLKGDIAKACDFSDNQCCCATFISTILYKSGLLEEDYINNYNYHGSRYVLEMLDDANWEEIEDIDDVQPGDICGYLPSKDSNGERIPGHVFIYVGDGYILDQSAGCKNSNGTGGKGELLGPEKWAQYSSEPTFKIYRPPILQFGIENDSEANLEEASQ